MKVGDLVIKVIKHPKQEKETLFGIVLKIDNEAVKVCWNKAYGTFWALQDNVKIAR